MEKVFMETRAGSHPLGFAMGETVDRLAGLGGKFIDSDSVNSKTPADKFLPAEGFLEERIDMGMHLFSDRIRDNLDSGALFRMIGPRAVTVITRFLEIGGRVLNLRELPVLIGSASFQQQSRDQLIKNQIDLAKWAVENGLGRKIDVDALADAGVLEDLNKDEIFRGNVERITIPPSPLPIAPEIIPEIPPPFLSSEPESTDLIEPPPTES